jgi:hypothetical protein
MQPGLSRPSSTRSARTHSSLSSRDCFGEGTGEAQRGPCSPSLSSRWSWRPEAADTPHTAHGFTGKNPGRLRLRATSSAGYMRSKSNSNHGIHKGMDSTMESGAFTLEGGIFLLDRSGAFALTAFPARKFCPLPPSHAQLDLLSSSQQLEQVCQDCNFHQGTQSRALCPQIQQDSIMIAIAICQ